MSNNKPTILVTGANGQLGTELKQVAYLFPHYHFVFTTKKELPIDDFVQVKNFFSSHLINYCINCAAYTAVDKAETESNLAFLINGNAVGNLALICNEHNTRLIHISTDYIFDGTATRPIKENHPVNPLGVYGASKLKGEELCLQQNPSAIIIRTSWVYSSYGHNFVKTMLRLMSEKNEINVVNDQTGLPTYAADLAMAIMQIIEKGSAIQLPSSVFNFSNSGNPITWYDFAVAIKEQIKCECKINPIPTSLYPTPAKRPAYSVLDATLIKETFDITIPDWKQSLERCILAINSSK